MIVVKVFERLIHDNSAALGMCASFELTVREFISNPEKYYLCKK